MDFDLIFNSNPSIESFREYKLNFRISSAIRAIKGLVALIAGDGLRTTQ